MKVSRRYLLQNNGHLENDTSIYHGSFRIYGIILGVSSCSISGEKWRTKNSQMANDGHTNITKYIWMFPKIGVPKMDGL